jgi:hypothetical protein
MMKHRLLVEKKKGNTCRKKIRKKRAFFLRFFLEVSVFTALTVIRSTGTYIGKTGRGVKGMYLRENFKKMEEIKRKKM